MPRCYQAMRVLTRCENGVYGEEGSADDVRVPYAFLAYCMKPGLAPGIGTKDGGGCGRGPGRRFPSVSRRLEEPVSDCGIGRLTLSLYPRSAIYKVIGHALLITFVVLDWIGSPGRGERSRAVLEAIRSRSWEGAVAGGLVVPISRWALHDGTNERRDGCLPVGHACESGLTRRGACGLQHPGDYRDPALAR